MIIKLIKQWRRKRVGETVDLPDGVANLLIRRHIAALPAMETAAVEMPVERAVVATAKPRKQKR